MIDAALLRLVAEALAEEPHPGGGIAMVLATASVPPATALLSTGDLLLVGNRMKIGIHGSSSAVSHLGGAFSLVVPLKGTVARVEVVDAFAQPSGDLALIQGTIQSIRPTAEPPWAMEMSFRPIATTDPRIRTYLEYWRLVRLWLSEESPEAPRLPHS